MSRFGVLLPPLFNPALLAHVEDDGIAHFPEHVVVDITGIVEAATSDIGARGKVEEDIRLLHWRLDILDILHQLVFLQLVQDLLYRLAILDAGLRLEIPDPYPGFLSPPR